MQDGKIVESGETKKFLNIQKSYTLSNFYNQRDILLKMSNRKHSSKLVGGPQQSTSRAILRGWFYLTDFTIPRSDSFYLRSYSLQYAH